MSTLHVNLIGRFGNQMFQYAYARAWAEENDMRLTTSSWVGEQIFDLPDHSSNGEYTELLPTEYHQDQASLIYTRKQVKEWFRFKPEIQEKLIQYTVSPKPVVMHLRRGDYEALGYVVVSTQSYLDAIDEFGYGDLTKKDVAITSSEKPTIYPEFDGELSFLTDFFIMTRAEALFRANSTFSWWAATLGNAKVYSPVIEGLEGGREQDCKFVEGNWPRFANLPFTSDLHLEEG